LKPLSRSGKKEANQARVFPYYHAINIHGNFPSTPLIKVEILLENYAQLHKVFIRLFPSTHFVVFHSFPIRKCCSLCLHSNQLLWLADLLAGWKLDKRRKRIKFLIIKAATTEKPVPQIHFVLFLVS